MIRTVLNLLRSFRPVFREHRGSYRKRLIWIGCVTVCVPVLLASTIYYQLSKHRLEEQIRSESRVVLAAVKDQVEMFLQSIEQSSHDLAIDPVLKRVFQNHAGLPRKDPFTEHLDILSAINIKKNSSSLVDEIYYYNREEPDIVLSNLYGAIAIDNFPYRGEIAAQMASAARTRWYNLEQQGRSGIVSFVRKLPVSGGNTAAAQGLLVFHVNMPAIQRHLFGGPSPNGWRQEFIVADENRQLNLSSYGPKRDAEGNWPKTTLERIGASGRNEGHFAAAGPDGRSASFSYVKNAFGRTYVSIVPDRLVSERLTWIRISTLLVLLFVIVIGLWLTYISSIRIYSPVAQLLKYGKRLSHGQIPSRDNEFEFIRACLDHLFRESEKLGHYVDKIEPTLRERCLQQLLNGDYVRKESLLDDCRAYGIEPHATYAVMVAELGDLNQDPRFMPKDKPILTYAVTNVMDELLRSQKHIGGHVVSFRGHGVVLLQFSRDCEHRRMAELAQQFAQLVHGTIKQVLRIEVSLGIGRFYPHIADVPVSCREAESALQYRVLRDIEPVLFIEQLEHDRKQTYHSYPKELEETIVDSLSKGELPAAEQALAKFAEVLRTSQSYNAVYQSYFLLLSSIVSSLERQGGHILELLESDWFGQLKRKQTSRDICEWFTELFFPMYRWLSEDYRNAAGRNAVGQVCQYIKKNCMSDISLVQCAELVGMSPSYLSRLFKKETGTNFLEYVMECKVERAKRLLLDTGLSVGEVASAIGYSERNMKRLFQRHTGVSPSVFRASHR